MKKIEIKRQIKFELNAWASVAIFLGILVVVMLIAKNHHKEWDLTANKRFSLAPQSVKILKDLRQPVQATGYYLNMGGVTRDKLNDLLKLYANETPKFTYDLVNMNTEPQLFEMGITIPGTVVLKYGKNTEKVTTPEEEKITNSLLKLIETKTLVAYFLKGHGETGIDDPSAQGIATLKDELSKQSFEARTLALSPKKGIPSDAAALIIPGPRMDFLPQEIKTLKSYIEKGGRCIIMLDPGKALPNLLGMMTSLGFELPSLALMDPVQYMGSPYLMLVEDFASHSIMKDFRLRCLFPITRPIEKGKAPSGASIETLISTSPEALGIDAEVLKRKLKQSDLNNAKRGPFVVAMVATYQLKEGEKEKPKTGEEPPLKKPEARLVVFGTSTLFENQFLSMPVGNRDLFLNTLSWLVERENLISIRPKESRSTSIVMPEPVRKMAKAYCIFLLPGAVVLAGVLMLYRRR